MSATGWTRDMHQRARELTVFCFVHHEIPQKIVAFSTDVICLEHNIKIPDPRVPMVGSYQQRELVSSLTFCLPRATSANVKCRPLHEICFAGWFHPPTRSRRAGIVMNKHALLSLVPPHRVTRDTAAMLSPLINIVSPFRIRPVSY